MVKGKGSIRPSRNPLSTSRMNTGRPPDKCEKGGTDCTRLGGNTKHAHYADLCNNQSIQRRHETSSPPSLLLPSPPSPTSSHSSSEVSSSEPSASCDGPPSCSMDSNVGETMELSSFQNEMKESESKEQDSRGGGLPCPNETSEWRSLNKAGIGDCRKSPRMGHWQQAEGVEL